MATSTDSKAAQTREAWKDRIREHQLHPDAPADDAYWAPELDCASRDELESIHSNKLPIAVHHLHAHSDLFRRKCQEQGLEPDDIRGVEDLSKLPITTKEDMSADLARAAPWGTYTALDDRMWLEDGWQIFQTSGTTSRPRPFRYTNFDRELWAWTNARALYAMGMRSGHDAVMLCFGYGPHVAMWGLHYALNLMGIPIVTGGGLDTRARAGMIDRYGPTTLGCTPSYALYLAATMNELGIDPAESSVMRLIVMGEPTPPTTAERLRSIWSAQVDQFYGCTEAAPSCGGYTCPHGLHFMEDTHILETLDPETLEPTAPGQQGLSVVTNLCSDASPQIRFLVGDYTTLDKDRCECGRTHVRAVGGFSGRADDMLNVRGVTLFPSAIEDVVRGIPELGEEFQIVLSREELDELTLVVEPAPDVPESEHAQVVSRLERDFRAKLELRPTVDLRPYGTLPKTEFKAKRVEDRRGE
jgi:phenylacetate-CoA ligase